MSTGRLQQPTPEKGNCLSATELPEMQHSIRHSVQKEKPRGHRIINSGLNIVPCCAAQLTTYHESHNQTAEHHRCSQPHEMHHFSQPERQVLGSSQYGAPSITAAGLLHSWPAIINVVKAIPSWPRYRNCRNPLLYGNAAASLQQRGSLVTKASGWPPATAKRAAQYDCNIPPGACRQCLL